MMLVYCWCFVVTVVDFLFVCCCCVCLWGFVFVFNLFLFGLGFFPLLFCLFVVDILFLFYGGVVVLFFSGCKQ